MERKESYFAAENIGVQHTSASNASLIVASFPAMTALLEFIIYRRRLERKKLFGIILAFGGVGILTVAQLFNLPYSFQKDPVLILALNTPNC